MQGTSPAHVCHQQPHLRLRRTLFPSGHQLSVAPQWLPAGAFSMSGSSVWNLHECNSHVLSRRQSSQHPSQPPPLPHVPEPRGGGGDINNPFRLNTQPGLHGRCQGLFSVPYLLWGWKRTGWHAPIMAHTPQHYHYPKSPPFLLNPAIFLSPYLCLGLKTIHLDSRDRPLFHTGCFLFFKLEMCCLYLLHILL